MLSTALLGILLARSVHPSGSSESLKALNQLEKEFKIESSGFLKESTAESQIAFNWSVGVYLSAVCAVTRLHPERADLLSQAFESADRYWNSAGPTPGFDVLPGPRFPNDRYYDDNAWVAMALIEAFEITDNPVWLTRAQQALEYVLSGHDEKLGGGIFWREKDRPSKNTCSNAPAAAACLALYRHVPDWQPQSGKFQNRDLSEIAKNLYQWTLKNLQDPNDGLYWDHLDLSGKIEKTKWSYNAALMIRSARELVELTKDQKYASDLARMESSAIRRWVQDDGSIDDELQFGHLLFENLNPSRFDAEKCIQMLQKARKQTGYFAEKWSKKSKKSDQRLIIQSSGVRALAVYEYWKQKGLVQ